MVQEDINRPPLYKFSPTELEEIVNSVVIKTVPVRIWTEFNHKHGLPQYETVGSSGLDVRANDSVTIPPNTTKLVPTGIFVDIPTGYEIQVRPRSGLSLKTPLRVGNSPGTIDCISKNTLLKGEDGYKTIDYFINDPEKKIYSYNTKTLDEELTDIISIWSVGQKETIKLIFDDNSEIECSMNQLILTKYGWKYANELNIADEVI